MNDPVFMSCDPANVDPSTGICSVPVWVTQPQFLPSLSVDDGAAIGGAILTCWAIAYMYRAFRQGGD